MYVICYVALGYENKHLKLNLCYYLRNLIYTFINLSNLNLALSWPSYSTVVVPIAWCPECLFLIFELGHFDLPNQLCDCIPGIGTYEHYDHVNLVTPYRVGTFPTRLLFSYRQMRIKHTFSKYETPILGNLGCLLNCPVRPWCPECLFLIFELGHFDLTNQLCDCIPVIGTYERCDHVNLVSAAPNWHIPYSITFWVIGKWESSILFLDTKPLFWAPWPIGPGSPTPSVNQPSSSRSWLGDRKSPQW